MQAIDVQVTSLVPTAENHQNAYIYGMKKPRIITICLLGMVLLSACASSNEYLRFRYGLYRTVGSGRISNESALEKEGYVLVLNETFDRVSWNETGDENHWKVGGPHLYNPRRLNVHYGPPELREGGYAAFTARYNPKEIYVYQLDSVIEFPYEVSKLFSRNFVEQQYGWFECRMTLPFAEHSWPAFWLWGRPWPPEIDVIEAFGRDTGKSVVFQEINLHYGTRDDPQQMGAWPIKIDRPRNIGQQFYEFAVEWTPDKIDFYTNGVLVFSFTDKEILDEWFSQPMWVVVNNNIRRAGVEQLGEDYYSEFLVDYVRVYKPKERD